MTVAAYWYSSVPLNSSSKLIYSFSVKLCVRSALIKIILMHASKTYVNTLQKILRIWHQSSLGTCCEVPQKKKHEMQQGELHSAVESVLGLPSTLGKGLFASVLWVVTAVCPSALGFKQKWWEDRQSSWNDLFLTPWSPTQSCHFKPLQPTQPHSLPCTFPFVLAGKIFLISW